MTQAPRYMAKKPDKNGLIHYSEEENALWQILYARQIELIQNRACDAYFTGMHHLGLHPHHVPQCAEVSKALLSQSGWQVAPVEALISFKDFFDLLAHKTFPAASFIRTREELDYLKEPDIFHEIFGHCPMLTDPAFAAFTEKVGKFGQTLHAADRKMLAQLYWFTVEFGLVKTPQGLRIYGAGILSSKTESVYALESDVPIRKPFDLMEVLRMPYRYDALQKVYYVIESIDHLYNLIDQHSIDVFHEAKHLGTLPGGEAITDYRSC